MRNNNKSIHNGNKIATNITLSKQKIINKNKDNSKVYVSHELQIKINVDINCS